MLLACFCFRAAAQEHVGYQKAIAGFEYIEMVKGKANGKLPLLIAFHYSGGDPIATLNDFDQLKRPVRIIIPKGNFSKRSGFSYYPSDYYQKDSTTQFVLAKKALDSLSKFVVEIEKKHQTLAIFTGISQGGDLSFLMARYHPDLTLAAIPIAPFIHDQLIDESFADVVKKPITIFQGEADPIILVDSIRKKVGLLSNKLTLKLFTYPGVKHEISPQMKIDYSILIDQYHQQ